MSESNVIFPLMESVIRYYRKKKKGGRKMWVKKGHTGVIPKAFNMLTYIVTQQERRLQSLLI